MNRGTPTAIHPEPHKWAGKTVRCTTKAPLRVGDELIQIGTVVNFDLEDWQDRVYNGQSWMNADGNPAALLYAMRAALPLDNDVVYGKINGLGAMMHSSELRDVVEGG